MVMKNAQNKREGEIARLAKAARQYYLPGREFSECVALRGVSLADTVLPQECGTSTLIGMIWKKGVFNFQVVDVHKCDWAGFDPTFSF